MSSGMRVQCDKEDCAFYTTRPGSATCYCTHGDKAHHLFEDTCPLYRPDWSKANDKASELRKRFGIGKK